MRQYPAPDYRAPSPPPSPQSRGDILTQLPLDLAAFKLPEHRPYTIAGAAGVVLVLAFFILPLASGFANQSTTAVSVATAGSWTWLLWLIPLAGIAAMAAAVRATRGPLSSQVHHTQGLVLFGSGAVLAGFLIGLLVLALQAAGGIGLSLGIGFWLLLLALCTVAGCGALIAHRALVPSERADAQAPLPHPPARYTPPASPDMRYRQPSY